ncbi:hypothetical protein BC826DRAFT_965701 [Russula brevipes]|nr:hypothetical protein BC826DRAFT_965701 [Russula brevipes]
MSTTPRLPTVRLRSVIASSDDESSSPQDSVVMDLPPSGKFGFAWPTDAGPAPSLPSVVDRHVSLSSSDADSPPSEHEPETEESTGAESLRTRRWSIGAAAAGRKATGEEPEESDFTTPTNRLNLDRNPLDQAFSLPRAFSVPLPSQIGYLKNPKRTPLPPSSGPLPPTAQPTPDMAHFHELSLELADSVQMIIQTLLQVSPPQVFDPAKEQFSACALPIPIPSVSALFTVMKSLNYIYPLSSRSCDPSNQATNEDSRNSTISSVPQPASQIPVHDFDIGETLQNVGDALSGMAADVGVDLVLFHGDVGMKHIAVKGSEIGICYTLSHIVRQFLAAAHRGDCVQIGLFLVAPVSPEAGESSVAEVPLDATEPADAISAPDPNSPLRCTFQVTHIFVQDFGTTHQPVRRKPCLDSHMLHRLVHHIDASLTSELTATVSICKLSVTLERGSPSVVNPAMIPSDNDPILQAFPDFKLSEEPTLDDLAQFVGTLKGKKVSLYADATGVFAQHLTSYLTSWGLDVSHASSDSDSEGSPARDAVNLSNTEHPPVVGEALGGGSILQTLGEQDPPPPDLLTPKAPFQSPSFILIDDDISVLRDRLQKLRAGLPHPFQFSRKRPNLAANHRPRSSPQVVRAIGHSSATSSPRSPAVIVHFTSLANFKLVKGIVQSALGSNGSTTRLPEVMVIPKPAGPRRVLTALRTAAMKPIIDPFFSPIATAPISPGLLPATSPFHQAFSPKSPVSRPSSSPRGFSYPSMRSPRAAVEHTPDTFALPPSPLGLSEGMDYFSEAAEKLGSSPSSGLVIQSPNGQPAGIFFHPPRSRGSRSSSQSPSCDEAVPYPSQLIPDAQARRDARDVWSESCRDFSERAPSGEEGWPHGGNAQDSFAAFFPAVVTGELQVVVKTALGNASVTSRENYIPFADEKAEANRAEHRPADQHNPINQTLLSTFMRKKKIKYDVAKNGEEAVEKWRSGRFHLILMDIQMPVMDGISATKEIRQLEKLNASQGYPGTPQTEGQRTPSDISSDSRMSTSPFRSSVIIVALTASSLQSDRVAALAAGCNDFLTKPVSLEWLNSKIIEWGSIKALQMFADSRPDFVKSVSAGQTVQAQNIARRLHMPEGRVSPSPSRPLSQPVVSGAGTISTGVSGSSQPHSDARLLWACSRLH